MNPTSAATVAPFPPSTTPALPPPLEPAPSGTTQQQQQRPPSPPQSTTYTVFVVSFDLCLLITHIVILALYWTKECLTVNSWLIGKYSVFLTNSKCHSNLASYSACSIEMVRGSVQLHNHEQENMDLFAFPLLHLVSTVYF